ncbi:hypothetical protein D9M69_544200 [compost metagenome]
MFAKAQDGLLGAQGAVELVVLPVADGAEQDGVGSLGQVECGLGQWMAVCLVGGAAHQGRFHFEGEVECLEYLDRFGHDFGADAVTRENCDFHEMNVWS